MTRLHSPTAFASKRGIGPSFRIYIRYDGAPVVKTTHEPKGTVRPPSIIEPCLQTSKRGSPERVNPERLGNGHVVDCCRGDRGRAYFARCMRDTAGKTSGKGAERDLPPKEEKKVHTLKADVPTKVGGLPLASEEELRSASRRGLRKRFRWAMRLKRRLQTEVDSVWGWRESIGLTPSGRPEANPRTRWWTTPPGSYEGRSGCRSLFLLRELMKGRYSVRRRKAKVTLLDSYTKLIARLASERSIDLRRVKKRL